jgi:hypothetical protein
MRHKGCLDLHFLSHHICQAIFQTYQQHPEWVVEKYRNFAWNQPSFRDKLTLKFLSELQKAETEESCIAQSLKLLQLFLIPSFFVTENFRQVWTTLCQSFLAFSPTTDLNSSSVEISHLAISVLLLDAENIQLNVEAENLITNYCHYPVQIKIAFANWRNLGKQDIDYHKRNYELMHVPAGKDSADLKMATFGASISLHYPTVKEVVICSSDKALTHLSNTLQSQGLIVYLVSRQGETITIFNSQTGHTHTQIIKPIPPINQFIQQLKDLIQAEQKNTLTPWIKLSKLSQLYKAKHHLRMNDVIAGHFPGKKAKDIFLNYPSEFVVHQPDNQSELYVTIFQIANLEKTETIQTTQIRSSSEIQVSLSQEINIHSKEDLENILLNIFDELINHLGKNEISLSTLASEFNKKYGQGVTQIIKQLQLGSKIVTFLKSCSAFQLKKVGKEYNVSRNRVTNSQS